MPLTALADAKVLGIAAIATPESFFDQLTAAGAAGGVLLGETLNYANDSHARKALLEGYNKGRSDAVKQQYWMMVNEQKDAPNQEPSISLYDIPLPEQQVDDVILAPRTTTLRIQE